MKEILARLQAPTPSFFKKLSKTIGVLTALITAIVMSSETLGVDLPEWMDKFFNVGTLILGVLATFIPQFATIWTDSEGVPVNDKPFEK